MQQELEVQPVPLRLLGVVDEHLPSVLLRQGGQEVEVALALLDADGALGLQRVDGVQDEQAQERHGRAERVHRRDQQVGEADQLGDERIGQRKLPDAGQAQRERPVLGADGQPLQEIVRHDSKRRHAAGRERRRDPGDLAHEDLLERIGRVPDLQGEADVQLQQRVVQPLQAGVGQRHLDPVRPLQPGAHRGRHRLPGEQDREARCVSGIARHLGQHLPCDRVGERQRRDAQRIAGPDRAGVGDAVGHRDRPPLADIVV